MRGKRQDDESREGGKEGCWEMWARRAHTSLA